MATKCKNCGIDVEKPVVLPNAEDSAVLSEVVGTPVPSYDNYCKQCVLKKLGLNVDHLKHLSALLKQVRAQKDLMVKVSTGGPLIQEKNEEYEERRKETLGHLSKIGIADPNPYVDLWSWYGKWSNGDLPSYKSRRKYIAELYDPLIIQIERRLQSLPAETTTQPTGWARVDRDIDSLRSKLEIATEDLDFQAVGLQCREALISLAQAVYLPEVHGLPGGSEISKTDADKMLKGYFAKELGGESNEEARRHAKSALSLANVLQHHRTAHFREAALCAEATRTVVNIVAIVSGRRDPMA